MCECLPTYMSVHHVHTEPVVAQEGVVAPGSGVTDGVSCQVAAGDGT